MLLLFVVAFLPRLIHVLAMRASPYFVNPVIDAATYDDAARSIASGHGHPDLIFWQPPGYSYFLGWIYAAAGPGYLAPRIVQALLGAASAVMTAWIGARLFDRRVGLYALRHTEVPARCWRSVLDAVTSPHTRRSTDE